MAATTDRELEEWFLARGVRLSLLDEQTPPLAARCTDRRDWLKKNRWAWGEAAMTLLAKDYDDEPHIDELRRILAAAGDAHGVEICELALGIAGEDTTALAEWHFDCDPPAAKPRARAHCVRWLTLRHILNALGTPEELTPTAGWRDLRISRHPTAPDGEAPR